MVSYSLKMHSYNVYDPSGSFVIARHTGYNLVITDDNGNVTIQGIDFAPDENNPDKAHISITESSAKEFTFVNKENPNITQKAYWSSDTTQEDINKYEFYTSEELALGNDALDAFNKIKLDAALTNLVNQIDYNAFTLDSRVCNTASNYWGNEYVTNFNSNIFETLPNGSLTGYYGKDDDYINAEGYQQAQKINFIRNIVRILDENGAINDILIDDYPYISEKYLSILEPILGQDFLANGDDIPLQELLLGIIQGIINLADFNIFNEYDKIKITINNNMSTAANTRSPLILDLDGDGVETIGTNSNVYFDHDDNGFAENSGWVGKDDGLLVRDLNNNGQIDDGTELFGNNSVLSSGEKAANGFEAIQRNWP